MSPFPTSPITFLAAAMVAISPLCFPQPPVRTDPGRGDTSPNSLSLFRHLDVDLRQPTGFEGVYQLSKVDAFGHGQTLFMRIDGAVSAVFPRSVYVPTQGGMVPDVPPGTIFRIGEQPESAPAGRGPNASSLINQTFATPSQSSEADGAVVREIPIARSLISNEVYRQRRLAALLVPETASLANP